MRGPFGKPCDRKRIIGTTGDASPLEYGGGVVYQWKGDGVTYTTWEFWDGVDTLPDSYDINVTKHTFTVYRVDVPDSVLREYCTPFEGDCNIHDPYHHAHAQHSGVELKCTCRPVSKRHRGGWVKIPEVADMIDMDHTEWARLACSRDIMNRVRCLDDIQSHYGEENLDSYPIELTGAEIKKRWRHHMKRGSWKRK